MQTTNEAPARRSRSAQWVAGGVLLAMGAVAVWYFEVGRAQPAPKQGRGFGRIEVPPVRVVQAEERDITVSLRALGTVTPINTVTVRSRLDGELIRVHFTEGQRVAEGQLLAEIDPRPYEVALAQAEGLRAENVARLNNLKTDLATFQSLYDRELLPRQQLTSQEALVRQVEGTIQSNDAQVNNAKLQLSYTRIAAPIAGRLGLRQVDPGNLIRSGDAGGLVVITQMQPISVLFTVPETDLPSVLAAMRRQASPTVEAWDRAESERLAVGTLRTVDNQIDTTTGTIRLRAVFDNAEERLFPNQFVNVHLDLSTLEDATAIPMATIQHAAFGTFVYVIQQDGTATVRRVTLGPVEADRVAITDGLVPGERVVLEGVDALSEGVRVEIVETSTGPAPQASAPSP